HRAQALLQEIALEAYAELQGPFALCVVERWPLFFLASPLTSHIFARRDLIEALPADVLRGVLAHEMAHKVQLSRLGWGAKLRFVLGYLASQKRRREIERDADEEAIRRGFGLELIAMRRWAEAHFPATLRNAHLNLSKAEIEERMRISNHAG